MGAYVRVGEFGPFEESGGVEGASADDDGLVGSDGSRNVVDGDLDRVDRVRKFTTDYSIDVAATQEMGIFVFGACCIGEEGDGGALLVPVLVAKARETAGGEVGVFEVLGGHLPLETCLVAPLDQDFVVVIVRHVLGNTNSLIDVFQGKIEGTGTVTRRIWFELLQPVILHPLVAHVGGRVQAARPVNCCPAAER